MRSIQTSYTFPLSSVKPLDGLLRYRTYCLEETRKALQTSTRRRERSPVGDDRLEPFGGVGEMEYLRCPKTGSLFLARCAAPRDWARLLADVNLYRRTPEAFHSGIEQSRNENVYLPKLQWIESTLRLQGVEKPRAIEVATQPSDFTSFLKRSESFSEVLAVDEMELRIESLREREGDTIQVAILPESLDRVDDPKALLQAVHRRLSEGGLIFITALVCSGFDVAVLGLRNLYLYPPDRTNCFSLHGLELLLRRVGFTPLEVSTPGVLDVEIVRAHLDNDPSIPLSVFESQILDSNSETQAVFQTFLQERKLSSFARVVGRKV